MKILLFLLLALPCIAQDSLHIEELGVYVKTTETPPPIPVDSFLTIDNAVKGIQGYQHNYTGSWSEGTSANWYATTLTYTVNGTVTFRFNGTKIEWYTEKGPTHGKVGVSIDGGTETIVDLYAPAFQQKVKMFERVTTHDIHTIKLRSTGTKNPASSNTYLLTDFFKIKDPGFVPDTIPPIPPPVTGDIIVSPGQSIKAAVESATSGKIVSLLEGTYNENLINVPVGVSVVGAGKLKTIINFTGSMAQQSEAAMFQLKGGSLIVRISPATAGISLGALLLLLFIVVRYWQWDKLWKGIVVAVIITVIIGVAIYIITQPKASTQAAGNQTISGFTINGKFACNGGIMVDGRDAVKILDVKVQETTYFGAWLKNTTGSEFANNELFNSSWASVGWVTGELCVHNITNTIIHHNFFKTTRNDKGYGIKGLWPDGTVTNSKFYNNKFDLTHFSLWNNGSAPNIDIELHNTFYNGIEIYENDFSVMGLSLASHRPTKGGRTIVRNNRFVWCSTAHIELVCSNITIGPGNVFTGAPMLTANFQPNGKWTDIIVTGNTFTSNGANPSWGGTHLIGANGMDMTITNNTYNNLGGYTFVKHMGPPANSVIVDTGNTKNQ